MSTAGDHNDVQLIGSVIDCHVTQKRITGVLLKVRTSDEDPLLIVVVPPRPLADDAIMRGDRIWVRGSLACDPNISRKSMHFIQARFLEPVKRANSTAMMAGEGGPT